VEEGPIAVPPLREVFHRGTGCDYTWVGYDLPPDRRERLAALVATDRMDQAFCSTPIVT